MIKLSKNAIEIIDLVKRYPTSLKRTRTRPGRYVWGSIGGLREVFFRRGKFIQALNKINLKIYRGEVFGLLGPNGAGKTTLIKILSTLVLPDGGEAYVNGYDVVEEPGKVLKNLQTVLGDLRGFDWRITARQNLEFFATLYGLSRSVADTRINELLDFTGLKDRADDMYQRFSSGMARKLQLCRSLLLGAPILLFDEPTIGLDPPSALDFRLLLKDKLARSENRTIFITTHNMWEAQSICDRVAIINRGNIIACDSPENLRKYVIPEKRYTITFSNNTGNMENIKSFMHEVESLKGLKHTNLDFNQLIKLIINVDRDFEISDILNLMTKHNFRIKDVESYEPSLEEAFISLTRGDSH